jgi:nitrogen fixation protein NifB
MVTVIFKGVTMENKIHPCYSPEASANHGRVHLPVAASCNIQCNYCNRKYDCVNESRPGVTSSLLSPKQAVYYLEKVQPLLDIDISVVGIAGPGDPFSEPEDTIDTMKLIRKNFPEKLLCLASNGLNVAEYAKTLADTGVNHVTITISAVDPEITAKIVSWVRFEKKLYRGLEAGKLLLERQLLAIKELKANGITVKINCIIIPGINDHHITEVAKTVSALGADVMNCLPFTPVEGSNFSHMEKPDHEIMQKVRWEVSQIMKLVKHCQMCRADAAGKLGSVNSQEIHNLLKEASSLPMNPEEHRPYVAVSSREGMLINEHLGQTQQYYIFDIDNPAMPLIEVRNAPTPGNGMDRWMALSETLKDCKILLVNQSGEPPKAVLTESGIRVILTEGLIDQALTALREGAAPVPVVNAKSCSGGGCGSKGGMC